MASTFTSNDLVLAIVCNAPHHKVRGKKRLQKLAYFLKSSGFESDVNFKIWDFGPFSSEVARAAEWLSISGRIIETEEQIGSLKMFTTVYSSESNNDEIGIAPRFKKILGALDEYSNVELEVAATIKFFLDKGHTKERAEEMVEQLKPSKALPQTVSKSFSIIREIAGI